MPARSVRRIHPQQRIGELQRRDDGRIVGSAQSEADKLEEIGGDQRVGGDENIARWLRTGTRSLIAARFSTMAAGAART